MDGSADTQSLYPYDGATLRLSGEVDLLTAPVLRLRLYEAAASAGVVVDLSAVTFMDCAGLGPLLEARKYLGTRLRLRDLPESLLLILRVCDLRSTFTVLDATNSPAGEGQSRPADDAPRQPLASHRGPREHSSAPVPHQDAVPDGGEPCDRRVARALDLQEAVTNATLIEEAQGLLMGTLGCDADEAWQLLLDVCRAYRIRVGGLAAVLVGDDAGTFEGIADPPLMDALRAVLPPAHEARAPAR